jgi:glycosyltransferase involved in cell wall biosynthesis
MRLAINLRLYVKDKIGGIENYVRHVLAGIAARQAESGAEWTVFAHKNEADNVRRMAAGMPIIEITHTNGPRVIERELQRGGYDLFFCPLLVLDPLAVPTPSVVTIPDIQHEFFPEYFDSNTLAWREHNFRPSALSASLVFTISEFSKRTIVEKYGADPAKIVVVGLDVDPEFRRPSLPHERRAFEALGLPESYLYLPANFWTHKNHSNVLRALRLLADSGYSDLALVLTGAPSTGMDRVRNETDTLGLAGRVRFLGYQPRWMIPEIYRHARALVFTTQFEGFGIPLLEAFHTGTPAVTSRAASCPEIAGDAAILVNERDPAAIADGIRAVLENPELRSQLIERGGRRALAYSWEKTVNTTMAAFDSVVQRSRANPRVEVDEHPTVGIVTPSYNMARFLEATIASVLSQTYPKIDYVVMDGGSTDGTLDILRKYEGRLRYQSAPDRGQADAVNRGFAATTGQIFTFLNADDIYFPNAVESAVRYLTANPQPGVVYGDAQYIDEEGNTIAPYPTRDFDRDALIRNCFICQPAAFMWRNVYQDVGGMNIKLHFALDYDLWIRISKRYPFVRVGETLAASRLHPSNKTLGQRRQIHREIIRVVGAHYGYVPYDWIYGYASYLRDGKDQILENGRSGLDKLLLSLLMGLRYNYRSMPQYIKEWVARSGVGDEFTGRWEDGWISRVYQSHITVPSRSQEIVISGRHLALIRGGLTLFVYLNESKVAEHTLREHGPFCLEIACPPEFRGSSTRITIRSSSAFRPKKNGDYRRLSCIIDSITAPPAGDCD